MNTKRLSSLLVASALTVGLGLGAMPGTAGAAETTAPAATRDLVAAKARCATAIDVRLTALTRLDATLSAAKNATADHKATQTASNTAAASGLGTLKAKIADDSDAKTLAADCNAIFEDYRVFALRAPQTHLVIAGDAETFAVAKVNDIVPRLTDAIAKSEAAGKDMTAAKAALADLQAKVADASSHASGVADSVIGFVPADYNADHGLLDGPRESLRTAATDLKAARADVKTIVAALKA
jgi:hypothetical protein